MIGMLTIEWKKQFFKRLGLQRKNTDVAQIASFGERRGGKEGGSAKNLMYATHTYIGKLTEGNNPMPQPELRAQ